MQHRTLTTLSSLRVGDIFKLPGKDEKYIVRQQGKTHTHVNIPLPMGPGMGYTGYNKYDDLVKCNKQVVFLRHTVPVAGETCLLSDLKEGDVFHTPDDIISEYIVAGGCVLPVRINEQPVPPLTSVSSVVYVRSDKK
jgi:hypothetical protein